MPEAGCSRRARSLLVPLSPSVSSVTLSSHCRSCLTHQLAVPAGFFCAANVESPSVCPANSYCASPGLSAGTSCPATAFSSPAQGLTAASSCPSPSNVVTLAGSGAPGLGQPSMIYGTNAQFYQPSGVAVDKITGNIWVADQDNYIVRWIQPSGRTSSHRASGQSLSYSRFMAHSHFINISYNVEGWRALCVGFR